MRTKLSYQSIGVRLTTLIVACCGMTVTQVSGEPDGYKVYALDSLGGTSSRGDGINNRGLATGYSNLAGNTSRHAAAWLRGDMRDLGTLGGPNSSVVFAVKDDQNIVVGISQTATPDSSGEIWSSGFFYPGPNNVGYVNLAFAWEKGQMRGLPTLGGGVSPGLCDRH